jgi:glycosyltransferase EpsE
MQPRISVITPVYNGEKYFDRAIPGILSQTLTDFEWLIVDDGSTDSTAQKLAELAQQDSRVRILSPGRLGFVGALDYAIRQAKSDYIARQDFDDTSYPERLQQQVDFLDAHPQVGVVGTGYVVEDENRNERYVRQPPTEHSELLKLMAKCVPFAHTLVAFRKQAWEQAGGYPNVKDGIEDLRLWIAFAKNGWQLAAIPETLGQHWVHPKSFWHKNFDYSYRQRVLAKVQMQAVQDLNLPIWMSLYPLGRYVYIYMPNSIKSFLRRSVAKSQEQDL